MAPPILDLNNLSHKKRKKNSTLVGVGRFACRDTAEGHGDLVMHVEVTRAGRAGWLGGVVLGEA